MSFRRGIFHVDVFPNGVLFEDVCDAISAAWHADHFELAEQIAREYGLYDQICLRCAQRWPAAAGSPSAELQRQIGASHAYQLCHECAWTLTIPKRLRRN